MGQWLKALLALAACLLLLIFGMSFGNMGVWEERAYQRAIEGERQPQAAQQVRIVYVTATPPPTLTPTSIPTPVPSPTPTVTPVVTRIVEHIRIVVTATTNPDGTVTPSKRIRITATPDPNATATRTPRPTRTPLPRSTARRGRYVCYCQRYNTSPDRPRCDQRFQPPEICRWIS